MGKPVMVALVGCGRIARGRHLRILSASAEFSVAALVDVDPAALDAAAALAPKAVRCGDFSELPAGVDAVVIASPPGVHAEQAIAAFRAGLHVYVEKPIATTLADAEAIGEAWRASGRVGMAGFNYRFHPMMVEARAALERRAVGRLVAVRSVFATPGKEHPAWKRERVSGGGCLLDLASHHVDCIRFVTGLAVEDVRGWLGSRQTEHDTGGLELTLHGNVLAQIAVAMGSIDEDCIEVIGEDGALVLDRIGAGHLRVRKAGRAGLRKDMLVSTLRACVATPFADRGTEVSTTRALHHFARAVRGEAAASPDIDDGLESLRVILAGEADALRRTPETSARPEVAQPTAAGSNHG